MILAITSLEPGGAEAQVVDLAVRLRGLGWAVVVASLLTPVSYVDVLVNAGVRVVSLEMPRGVPDPRGLVRLVSELRREDPAILHGHMFHANILTRVAGAVARTPVVISTIHSVLEGGAARDVTYRVTDRLAHVTTAVSQAAADRYVSAGAVRSDRLRVVPNGVDLRRFRPDAAVRDEVRTRLGLQGRFAWIAVGRLDPAKDYPTMLRAFELVSREVNRRKTLLLVAGGGPRRDEADQLVRDLRLGSCVRLLGHRDDVPDLLRAADGYVMTSAVEGLPMSLLEAASTGLPIVTTDVGGNSEIVLHGRNGLLVPPRDQVAVAGAVESIMEMSDGERLEMGRSGREHAVGRFALDAVVEIWNGLYEELADHPL